MMELEVTRRQYKALIDIYGPPANIHNMIMTCMPENGKFLLRGEEGDFDDLLSLIGEEVGEDLCTESNAKALLGICKKIDPSSLDWIGM